MAKIRARSLEKLQVLLEDGSHAWLADEPASAGGDGLGPDPYEMLLSALGACTVMTVQLYAKRKGWDLRAVRSELVHERIHASDCEDCEQKDGYIERIRVNLAFEGDLDDEQLARLKEIAGKCPVRRTLLSGPKIVDM
ncbi:MAG: OsmC family protein [Bryobacterales bacterium]|nr:OsmC family protein [Bryobacterales bacterium]